MVIYCLGTSETIEVNHDATSGGALGGDKSWRVGHGKETELTFGGKKKGYRDFRGGDGVLRETNGKKDNVRRPSEGKENMGRSATPRESVKGIMGMTFAPRSLQTTRGHIAAGRPLGVARLHNSQTPTEPGAGAVKKSAF